MVPSVVALAAASILAALAFLDVVAYLDDGTTLCEVLYTRVAGSSSDS